MRYSDGKVNIADSIRLEKA